MHKKDEKSQSKEEDLEEMTDGELEEVEKLKAWETWLKERQSPLWNRIVNKDLAVIPLKYQEIFKYTSNAGDAKFGNQHESATEDDQFVDDEQIYIGKPAKSGKGKKEND